MAHLIQVRHLRNSMSVTDLPGSESPVVGLTLDDTQYKELLYNMKQADPQLYADSVAELEEAAVPNGPQEEASPSTMAAKDVQYETAVKDAQEEKTGTARAASQRK